MAVASEMRWPEFLNPAQLRSFYAEALYRKNIDSTRSTEAIESQCISSPTLSSSNSDSAWASSSSSISTFSGHALTASSATSVSDGKTIVALAPRARYEGTADLLNSHVSRCSCTPNGHAHAVGTSLGSDAVDVDFVTTLRGSLDKAAQRKGWIGGNISRPKYSQDRDEASRHNENIQQQPDVETEPDIDATPWLDTLREHPYYNLDSDRKLGHVGTWAVKIRRRDLKVVPLNNQETTDADSDEGIISQELLAESPSLPSDDETIHFVDDDVGEETASFMGSSKSTLGHCCSRDDSSGSSERVLPLDLGMSSSLSSLDSHCLGKLSILSSSASTLELSGCTDLGEMSDEDAISSTRRIAGRSQRARTSSYYCIFCFDQFSNEADWEDHEHSKHVATQRDWICMPWGAIEKRQNGNEICVFCGLSDPTPSHCSQHNDEPCRRRSPSRRTFRSKEDFQDHLWKAHDQHTMTECMENWSYPAEEEDWYWQCGFCERSLVGWTDRVRHIGGHFRKGLSLACWDPFVPACPIDRSTGMAVSWSPPVEMDRRALIPVQHEQSNLIDRYDGSFL